MRVGILFGGKSGEHEVSILSACNIVDALDQERYEAIPVGVDKSGVWRIATPGRPLLIPSCDYAGQRINPEAPAVRLGAGEGGSGVVLVALESAEQTPIDLFFPIIHGSTGEDGCVQGLLRLFEAPFVGAGVLGSAIGMDKDVMKRLLREAGLPGPRFVVYRSRDRDEISFDVLVSQLGLPLYVKPCNLGSSVGVTRVACRETFEQAVAVAFQYDRKIIIEEAIVGREIECSVLGNGEPQASAPGEIIPRDGFYSYEAKYVDADGAALEVPARLDADTVQRVRDLAVRVFEVLECSGLARVDFFLRADGALLVNELNTLPGFTRISMYPKLWAVSGLSYGDLLDRLIELALEVHREETALKRSFDL